MKIVKIENLDKVRLNSMNMLPGMRFIENGSFIPGDLLFARDQGKVVFVCGAGVSQARAKIPDFPHLSRKVCELLGVSSNPDYSKYLEKDSVLPFDRMFGTLEREFNKEVVENTVCKILKPKHTNNKLAAHRILLDLAKSDDGVTKIVTTNFDRLFNACDKNLQLFTPARLPDVKTLREFNGIVHLHGIANKKYDSPEADGFVLSSSSFGRAYLSEGWATKFFLDLIENFTLVFIGYRADDPPVSYLLEALARTSRRNPMYAFQEGDEETASSAWTHKGVQAIPYDNSSNDHSALWNTLELWARRANNRPEWIASTLALAQRPPEALKEFEKEQVLQLTSSEDGMEAFMRVEPPPPVQWLCALTSADFFRINSADVIKEDEVLSSALIRYKDSYSLLPPRLHLFRGWFEKHINSPYAMCWASEQRGLHPRIVKHIDFKKSESFNRHIWGLILEQWKRKDISSDQVDTYLIESKCDKLAKELKKSENDLSLLDEFFRLNHPIASIQPANDWRIASQSENCNAQDLFNITVHYPNHYEKIIFLSDRHSLFILRKIREHIDWAYQIDTGNNYRFDWHSFNELADDGLSKEEGLRFLFRCYSMFFERVVFEDIDIAKSEYYSWPKDGNLYLWGRLRIWAQKFTELFSATDIFNEFGSLSDGVFWDFANQRDLLISLKTIWNHFSIKQKRSIENRISSGSPTRNTGANEEITLEIFNYLLESNCILSDSAKRSYVKMKTQHPEFNEKTARDPTRTLVPKVLGGMVRTITAHNCLENVSIRDVIKISKENSRREFLEDYNPFLGLVRSRPMRAFHGLVHHTSTNDLPEKEWEVFFYEIGRNEDFCNNNGFKCHVICRRILRYENEILKNFINPLASWFSAATKSLSVQYPDTYELFMDKLVSVIAEFPEVAKSTLVPAKENITSEESLNSIVFHITNSWLSDKRFEAAKTYFTKKKLSVLEKLLGCGGIVRRYSLLRLSEYLAWLFYKAKSWTRRHILSIFESHNHNEMEEVLYGCVFSRSCPHPEVLLAIKDSLFDALCSKEHHDRYNYCLRLLQYMWFSGIKHSGKYLVTDKEFSDILQTILPDSRSVLLNIIRDRFRKNDSSSVAYRKLRLFFTNIWPKQKKYNTSKSSTQILTLMLSSDKIFSSIYNSVKDFLCELDHYMFFPNEISPEVLEKNPSEILLLLRKCLPHDINRLPYGIGDVLRTLGTNDKISNMRQYKELMRTIEDNRR